jgi:hypothetical protein
VWNNEERVWDNERRVWDNGRRKDTWSLLFPTHTEKVSFLPLLKIKQND